jgi:hypothetical protein
MKSLLSAMFVVMILPLSHCDHLSAQGNGYTSSESVKIAGKWQLSVETPHGLVEGPLEVKQDGGKLSGTFDTGAHAGVLAVTGTVEDNKVSFSMVAPQSDTPFTVTGTVEGAKMSGTTVLGDSWTATRATY